MRIQARLSRRRRNRPIHLPGRRIPRKIREVDVRAGIAKAIASSVHFRAARTTASWIPYVRRRNVLVSLNLSQDLHIIWKDMVRIAQCQESSDRRVGVARQRESNALHRSRSCVFLGEVR